MSCYLNVNLSKINPEGKFKFPGEKYEPIRLRELQRLRIDRDFTTSAVL